MIPLDLEDQDHQSQKFIQGPKGHSVQEVNMGELLLISIDIHCSYPSNYIINL